MPAGQAGMVKALNPPDRGPARRPVAHADDRAGIELLTSSQSGSHHVQKRPLAALTFHFMLGAGFFSVGHVC